MGMPFRDSNALWGVTP